MLQYRIQSSRTCQSSKHKPSFLTDHQDPQDLVSDHEVQTHHFTHSLPQNQLTFLFQFGQTSLPFPSPHALVLLSPWCGQRGKVSLGLRGKQAADILYTRSEGDAKGGHPRASTILHCVSVQSSGQWWEQVEGREDVVWVWGGDGLGSFGGSVGFGDGVRVV